MGEYYFVYSGASRDTLPLNPGGVEAILFNAPSVMENDSSKKNTHDLIHDSKAKRVFLDSGGFTQFRIEQAHLKKPTDDIENNKEKNDKLSKTKIIFDRQRPALGKELFNLTPVHVADACMEILPDVTICPDLPVPPESDPGAQEYQWMKSYTYNLWCTREMLKLRTDLNLDTQIYLPVQCYTVSQLRRFLQEFDWRELNGFSIPNRLLKQIQVAPQFLMEFYQMKVKKVHILGASNFEKIAIASYFAKNFFESTSIDARSIIIFAFQGQYMKPYDLRIIDIYRDIITHDDDAVFRTCTCGLCEKTTIMGIKEDLTPKERVPFLAHHNYHTVIESMEAFFDNADSADMLIDFLINRTKAFEKIVKTQSYKAGIKRRYEEIKEIHAILSNVEFLKKKIDNGEIV